MPEETTFQTKPALTRDMLERAFRAGVPAAWVTGDKVYGRDRRLRIWLEEQERPFVLAVPTRASLWVQTERGPQQVGAAAIAATLTPESWVMRSAGGGTQGPCAYAWARARLARWPVPGWEHWLLARKSPRDATGRCGDLPLVSVGEGPHRTTSRTDASEMGRRVLATGVEGSVKLRPTDDQAAAISAMTAAQRSWNRRRRSANETRSTNLARARKYWRCSSQPAQQRAAAAKAPNPRMG